MLFKLPSEIKVVSLNKCQHGVALITEIKDWRWRQRHRLSVLHLPATLYSLVPIYEMAFIHTHTLLMAGAESNWRVGGAEAALKRRIWLCSDSPPVCSARQQCLGLLISLWFSLGSCRAVICILHNKAFRWYVSDEHIFWVRQQKFGTIWCHCTTDQYGKCKAQLCVKLFILAG